MPHVVVALRMNKKHPGSFKINTVVPYIVCKSSTDEKLASNIQSYHLSEMSENPNLSIDAEYYLKQQIEPVVKRLCQFIPQINSKSLGQALGFKVVVKNEETNKPNYLSAKKTDASGEATNPLVYSIALACPKCSENIILLPDKNISVIYALFT